MTTLRIRDSVVLTSVLLLATAFTAQAQAPSSLSGRIPRRFALGADSVLESAKPDLGPYYVPGSSYGVWGEGRQVPGLQAITRTNHGNDVSFDAKDSYANAAREFPRLCRGGSRSLTDTDVGCRNSLP